MMNSHLNSPDRGPVARLAAMASSLDTGGERIVEVVRGIVVLPSDLEAAASRFSEALTALFVQPDFASLSIRAYCPSRGEPLQFYVGQCSNASQSGRDHDEIASRRIETLLAYLWPDAVFLAVNSTVPELPVSIAIRPAVQAPKRKDRPGPRLYPAQPATDSIIVERISQRNFDVLTALNTLAQQAPSELVLSISPFILDAHILRDLEVLELRQRATRLAGHEQSNPADNIPDFINALREAGIGVQIDVTVRLAQDPDPVVADLVCLALYGAPMDRGSSTGLDLRSVWALGAPLPRLLPSPLQSRKIADRARPIMQPPLRGRGSVRLGRLSGSHDLVLSARDRARHLYCLGSTGTGKSTLLLNMLRQDICAGEGVILIDPHGDLADATRELVPAVRRQDLVWSDMSDPESVLGLNILEGQGAIPELERNYICNQLISLFKNVLYRDVPEAFGPMFETYFRNGLMLLMSGGGSDVTLMDFERVFHDGTYRNHLIANCPDQKVREFWKDVAEKASYSEITLENVTPYIVCKLTQLTGNPLVRRVIDVRQSHLDLRSAMDNGRVVLIKLAKGLIGDYDTSLIATLLSIRIAQIGMARAAIPPERRRAVRLYIDEFQNCAGEVLASMLAESRKYGISLTLANQSLSQIDGRGTHNNAGEAALANAANLVVCRVGAPDADRLAPWFEPDLLRQELCRLPDFHAAVRVLDQGRPAPVGIVRLPDPPLAWPA
jgi:hypothetical protein